MIINACHPTFLGLSAPIDFTCSRVALLDAHPQGLLDSCAMEYVDLHHHHHHHQYKHHQQHHHHHHIQQQPPQPHHSHQPPVGGNYIDLGSGFIPSEASPIAFDALPHSENQYVDQYGSSSVQASYKPCEDGYASAKMHEDAHLPPKACEDVHILPARNESLHFACDRGYSQQHLHSSASMSAILQPPRIRVLCSIGGRIMGRPADGRLRYCGGETRLISLERGLSFLDLMSRMTQVYGSPLILKYQLPGEDLDALVSISSDDDLQNMLDEYDKLVAGGGNSWFRLFLFKIPSDSEIFSPINLCHGQRKCHTEIMQTYISAINGASDLSTDRHLERSVSDHYLPSRTVLDASNTTLSGPYFPAKSSSRVPSAPSSLPSSPSVASRHAHHKQCGAVDACHQLSKDQQSFVTTANGIDMNTQDPSQECHADILKCDHHQSHIPVESPRIQQDYPLPRGDAVWAKENGMCFVNSHDAGTHQFDWHRGTGAVLIDTRHDTLKPYGPMDLQCETCCGNHLVTHPLTSLYHVGQAEDDFGRVEPMQHCFVEGHKHMPFLHQSHQAGTLVHREIPIRLQRGPAIDLTCQSTEEPLHPHVQIANVMSSVPVKAMGSAPSSPQDACYGRCCSCRQYFQVDRGISVSLGEHSYSKKPSHFGDQSTRRHGLPLLSRFCDGSNFCSDPAAWHGPSTLGKGLELDEQECLQKLTFDRINTRGHVGECCAKESAAHGFVDPVHGLHERSLQQCRYCCTDFHDGKVQHIEKARGFPASSEFQAYMGECDVHPGNNEEGLSILSIGRLIHDQKADLNIERGNDSHMSLNANLGQGGLEARVSGMQDGRDALGYAHGHVVNPSSMLGHQESGCHSRTESFSSTDAVAGSLSRPSLEPPVWVVSPPLAIYDDRSKERETLSSVDLVGSIRQLGEGANDHEGTGARSPSFGCVDSTARLRSIKTSRDVGECRVESLPVSSLAHVPDDNIRISYAHGSHRSSQPFPVRTLDSETLPGSITLALPVYDQSPMNSVNNAPFSFAQNEDASVNKGKDAPEQSVNSVTTLTAVPYQSAGHHQEMGKVEADIVVRTTLDQECTSMLEDAKSVSRPLSRQCSVEVEAHDKGDLPSTTLPMAQSGMINETSHEVSVSGSVNVCLDEDEKELPATQAEAEAIARGLQIIKNDDLEDLRELGSGTYGTVFHGKWRGSDVAIKRIKASCFTGRPSVQERLISDFWREAGTLSQLHHPNIVAFYGVVPDGPEGTLATVTEYMVNGSLKQVLSKKDRTIDRRKRLLIAMDAAFGMEYLHSKRIVHFDLKSENLLVNMRDAHRPICKVGDFGLSKVKHQTLVSGGVRGTLPWIAPELLSGKGLVTEKVDVYSFGIVMWELLTGEEPYANMHCGTIIGGIVHNNLRPTIPTWCDPSWRELMERCWSANPADRPDFAAVASDLRSIASSMNVK